MKENNNNRKGSSVGCESLLMLLQVLKQLLLHNAFNDSRVYVRIPKGHKKSKQAIDSIHFEKHLLCTKIRFKTLCYKLKLGQSCSHVGGLHMYLDHLHLTQIF